MYNKGITIEQNLTSLAQKALKFWSDLKHRQIKRKLLINDLLVTFLTKKTSVFGHSASIEKALHIIQDFLKEEDLIEYYSIHKLLTNSSKNVIRKFMN